MSLLLNGFGNEPGSDDLIGSFESGSGKVAPSEDFADAFLVESVQTVPNYATPTTENFDIAQSIEAYSETEQPATVATQSGKSAGDYIGDIFGNLWGSVKTTLEAGAQGAIEGATAASQGAQTGASVGAKTTTLSTTTLLLGGLVLVLLLRR